MSGASRHVLVVGGQRSGKSRFAEGLISASGLAPVYLATAEAGDREMVSRIATHRARRGDRWRTVEAPLLLPETIAREAAPGSAVLVECLTLWLSNLMAAGRDLDGETTRLTDALAAAGGPVVLVSNEVGSGIVPANALARRYADALGDLNRRVAGAVAQVFLVAAGEPVRLKPSSPEPRL